jgi:hypothetical protein
MDEISKLLAVLGFMAVGGTAMSEEKPEELPNPMLPDVPYRVHDMTRPLPPVVKTAGAVVVEAPGDATILFDGTSIDAWEGDWKIVDGILVASPKNDLLTKESFGPIQLHLEWRVPAGRAVDGQKGGNSGVFFMNKYEVQVLQSHENRTYADGQAGALYGQYPPLANATTTQGEWQSYDITFEPPVYEDGKIVAPARATVIHNGVVLQHAQPFMGPTTHKKLTSYPAAHPETGPLRLQWHKDPVEFRNIWVRPLGVRDGRQ